MAATPQDVPRPTAVSLVTGIFSDLQLLVEQQFQLTRCEIEQELRQRAAAGLVFAASLAGYFLSAFMLSLAAAHGLHRLMQASVADADSSPLWACEMVVGIVLCGGATLLLRTARRRLREVTVTQNPATEILQDSRQWTTRPR